MESGLTTAFSQRLSIRKTTLFLVASLYWASGLATAEAQSSAKCVTVQDVRDRGGWTITTQVPTYEPYWFADANGHFEGMDYDLLVEVNKILKIPTTHYTAVPWAGVLPALQSGKSDFVPEAVGVTDERRKTFGFSYPEGDNSVVIMTRPDAGIKATSDLVGKTIGVETGSAGEAIALNLRKQFQAQGKEFTLKSYENNFDELLDLGNKRLDAVLLNVAPVTAYMKQHPGKFLNVGLVGTPLYASWAFRKEDFGGPDCIGTQVNAALKRLHDDGEIKALQVKWFGHEMPLPDYDTWKTGE